MALLAMLCTVPGGPVEGLGSATAPGLAHTPRVALAILGMKSTCRRGSPALRGVCRGWRGCLAGAVERCLQLLGVHPGAASHWIQRHVVRSMCSKCVQFCCAVCDVHWLLWLAMPGEAGACAAAALVLGHHQAQPHLVWVPKAGRGGLCCKCLLSDVGVPGGTASQVAVKPCACVRWFSEACVLFSFPVLMVLTAPQLLHQWHGLLRCGVSGPCVGPVLSDQCTAAASVVCTSPVAMFC